MKIEKLNKENIKDFIKDMKLNDNNDLELTVDKKELYGLRKDDIFYMGFNSLNVLDTIAILYFNPKLPNDIFYECIDFLNKSLVVENHLIIEVYNDKYMKLLEDKYKCKELTVAYEINESESISDMLGYNTSFKEKLIDIDMKSIKYYASKEIIVCNLIKQNIWNERLINELHNSFINNNVNNLNFIINNEYLEYFINFGYKCLSRSYVIKESY